MPARDLALLTALLALLLAWPLVSPPIHRRGEAREALVVRDIVQRGDWVLPRRLGALASKPPLFHWMGAATAHVIGLSDVSVRLPSAIAAWVMAVATFVLGCVMGGRRLGWLAAGVLLGTAGFWRSALEARVDMVFAAAVTVSLAAFWTWRARGHRGARALCWLAPAAAVLSKGPAGLVLPGLVVGATLACARDRARVRALWSWPLATTTAGIVALWYAAAVLAGGGKVVTVHLVRENLNRVVGRGGFADRTDRGRLIVALLVRLAPWSSVLPLAGVRWWQGRRETDDGRFLHAWWIVVLAVFTASAGQRPVYLLPLYPAIALLAARALAPWSSGRGARTVALLAAFDLAMLGGVQIERTVAWRNDPMPSFARAVAAAVPPDAPLRATPGVSEDAFLVLAWRLGRDMVRAPFDCDAYYLRPVPSRADARSVVVLAASQRVTLAKCGSS